MTPPSDVRTRVFVVDDHELVRRGLTDLLADEPDMEVVGEAATVAEAKRKLVRCAPDIVLVDFELPDGTGLEICRFVQSSAKPVRCIIVTAHDDETSMRQAMDAGAAGYLIKTLSGNRIVESVRLAGRGRRLPSPVPARRMERDPQPGDDEIAHLTARQREVLWLVTDGLSNRQIAAKMGLAVKTVKNRVSELLAELNLSHRTQLVAVGIAQRPFRESEDQQRAAHDPA